MPNNLDTSENPTLSKQRVQSSIPRSSDDAQDTKWMYPSEQMFFNAMKRKGGDPKEEEMSMVVNIHNIVNEQCWVEILRWESMHKAYHALLLIYL
jgi:cytochrome c heme-lyase